MRQQCRVESGSVVPYVAFAFESCFGDEVARVLDDFSTDFDMVRQRRQEQHRREEIVLCLPDGRSGLATSASERGGGGGGIQLRAVSRTTTRMSSPHLVNVHETGAHHSVEHFADRRSCRFFRRAETAIAEGFEDRQARADEVDVELLVLEEHCRDRICVF